MHRFKVFLKPTCNRPSKLLGMVTHSVLMLGHDSALSSSSNIPFFFFNFFSRASTAEHECVKFLIWIEILILVLQKENNVATIKMIYESNWKKPTFACPFLFLVSLLPSQQLLSGRWGVGKQGMWGHAKKRYSLEKLLKRRADIKGTESEFCI